MLRPLFDYIVVKPLIRKQSDVIEVVSNEKHCRGEIVAVGPGKFNKKGQRIPLVSQAGQIVIFGNGDFDFYPKVYEGTQIFRLIQEADIAGVIEEAQDAA